MTGVIRWNKSKTPAGADGWNLTTDLGTALDTANVIVPVATQAERDGLTPPVTGKYAGMVVARTDIAGMPLEKWDGSAWIREPVVDTGEVTTDGFWTISGGLTRTVLSGRKQVTATLQMTRTTGSITINTTDSTLIIGMLPAGFRPPGNHVFPSTSNTNTGTRYAEPQMILNNGGSLVGRSTSGGSVTIGVGYVLFISTTWEV